MDIADLVESNNRGVLVISAAQQWDKTGVDFRDIGMMHQHISQMACTTVCEDHLIQACVQTRNALHMLNHRIRTARISRLQTSLYSVHTRGLEAEDIDED